MLEKIKCVARVQIYSIIIIYYKSENCCVLYLMT